MGWWIAAAVTVSIPYGLSGVAVTATVMALVRTLHAVTVEDRPAADRWGCACLLLAVLTLALT